MINSYYSSSPSVVNLSIAGTIYEFGNVGQSPYILNTENGTIKSFTSLSAFEWYSKTLISAGNRAMMRVRLTLWVVALILSIKVPAPTAPAAINMRGEYYPETLSIETAYAKYRAKYGVQPTQHKVVMGRLWVAA